MEAQAKQQPTKRTTQQRNQILVLALVVVAVVAAVVAIALSGSPTTSSASVNYDSLPKARTADGAFVIGNADAPITIVEFADFTCSHCQEYEETTERFINDFVATGQAKFEYRLFPVTGSSYMNYSAQVAECADTLKPGSFWAVRELLFKMANRGQYENMGQQAAELIGANYADLLQCTRTAKQYVTDSQVGSQAGVSGTPAVMVRYGDGDLQWINMGGQLLSRGAVAYDILAQVVRQNQ